MKNQAKREFTPCSVKVVFVSNEDVIRTSGGAEIGTDVPGAFTDWGSEQA